VPVEYEFGGLFEKAAQKGFNLVGLVPSFTAFSQNAGLHFVLKKLPDGKPKEKRHYRPFLALPDLELVRADNCGSGKAERMLKLLKLYPRLLFDEGLINGAFFQPELHIGFYPCQPSDDRLKVAEALLPHLNMLVTTTRRPDWHWARKCWEIWRIACQEYGIMRNGIGYPDLFVDRRMDQPHEPSGWLSYCLKAK